MSINVDISHKLISHKAERQKELNKKLENSLKRGGYMVEREAKQDCPRDTSRLAASISTNWTGSGMGRAKVESPAEANDGISQPAGGKDEFIVVIGTNVDYASPVEFGTTRRPATPFLFPALEKNKDKILELLK